MAEEQKYKREASRASEWAIGETEMRALRARENGVLAGGLKDVGQSVSALIFIATLRVFYVYINAD